MPERLGLLHISARYGVRSRSRAFSRIARGAACGSQVIGSGSLADRDIILARGRLSFRGPSMQISAQKPPTSGSPPSFLHFHSAYNLERAPRVSPPEPLCDSSGSDEIPAIINTASGQETSSCANTLGAIHVHTTCEQGERSRATPPGFTPDRLRYPRRRQFFRCQPRATTPSTGRDSLGPGKYTSITESRLGISDCSGQPSTRNTGNRVATLD